MNANYELELGNLAGVRIPRNPCVYVMLQNPLDFMITEEFLGFLQNSWDFLFSQKNSWDFLTNPVDFLSTEKILGFPAELLGFPTEVNVSYRIPGISFGFPFHIIINQISYNFSRKLTELCFPATFLLMNKNKKRKTKKNIAPLQIRSGLRGELFSNN